MNYTLGKTPIKIRVTPEQSEIIQKICFANKIFWYDGDNTISMLDASYVYITNTITYSYNSINFTNHSNLEVNADELIKKHKGLTMTKKEWLQALLDGKTMTSDYAKGDPIIFGGAYFEDKDSYYTDVNYHNSGLREYFEYPMWFKAGHDDYIVKFTSRGKGVVVQANNVYKVGHSSDDWIPHTDTLAWTQVEEPIDTKEVTIEELEAHYGCKVKIVKN